MDYRGHVSNYTVQLGYAWSGDAGGYTAEGDGLSSLCSIWAGLLFRQGPFCPSAATSSALSSRRRTEAKSTHLQQLQGVLCTISASQSFPPPGLVPVVQFEPNMFQEGGWGSGGGGR